MTHESLQSLLEQHFAAALAEVTGQPVDPGAAHVRPAGDPKFGDYQCNAAMPLARPLKAKPRDIAQRIKDAVAPRLAEIAEPLEIAGPGFLNIHLKPSFLAEYLGSIPAPPAADDADDRVGLPTVGAPQRVIVEYSQPNIAKQMHVGHLRGTIIGDVFARTLAFLGHDVIRQNHIGDWGTQFGMLIRWYREHPLPSPESAADPLDAIEADYRAAQERFERDAQFADESRRAVGALQSGDAEARRIWEALCAESWRAFTEIYERLGVLLRPEDVRGESFYNDKLAPLVQELKTQLAPGETHVTDGDRVEVREDQGAVCAFIYDAQGEPRFKNPAGEILPMIIQKSDGAFLYATTDLAAIRFRLEELDAQRVIYVTDARQKLHFQMWMEIARAAGWITSAHSVEHVTFGTVMGPDRKPLKTRSGKSVKLRELLDEAERRAIALLDERDAAGGDDEPAALTADEKQHIGRRVGIAAIKYADLSRDRAGDYVFDWDTMLAFQGNTAPYMMYAYARIRSIYRKALDAAAADVYGGSATLRLAEPAERTLALKLARFGDAVEVVATDLTPHTLCTYLYELATEFMRFYESCPVLKAPDDATRLSRMRLCDLTARTLKRGLGLLGIAVVERM
jgi:arginyl-tRNA synthetase